ncbi:hypothetical protein ACIBCD_42755 [Nocardia brasiliensis]|uniref:hypothetical protein n=1 Tax=Nocardia brasiliensis TaxID=37326 RepID=UPI00379F6A12
MSADVLAIHAKIAARMDGASDSSAALLFQRSDADVVQMLAHAFHDDRSESTAALVKHGLRSMSAEAVLGLVDSIKISMATTQLDEDERDALLGEDVRGLLLCPACARGPDQGCRCGASRTYLDDRRAVGQTLEQRNFHRQKQTKPAMEVAALPYRSARVSVLHPPIPRTIALS